MYNFGQFGKIQIDEKNHLGDSPEAMQKLCLFAKFPHQETGEITVFFVVNSLQNLIKFYERQYANTLSSCLINDC